MKQGFTLLLLLLVLILVNFLGGFSAWKVDSTEGGIYTLSDGSLSLIEALEEPLVVQFYFSKSANGLPVWLKNYASRIHMLLKQYGATSHGRVRVEMIDPKPDTQFEESAIRSGLSSFELPATGRRVFMGLLALQAEKEAAIPFFSPEREKLLEFDISQLIYRVNQGKRSRIGLLTSLPLIQEKAVGAKMLDPSKPNEPILMQKLRNLYDIVPIRGNKLPKDLDALLLIHPRNISKQIQYSMDQFVLSGKPVLIAVDPSSWAQRDKADRSASYWSYSDLNPLFKGWGVSYDPNEVIGDLQHASRLPGLESIGPDSRPTWLELSPYSHEHPISAALEHLLIPEAGHFKIDMPEAKVTPLLTSSLSSSLMMSHTAATLTPSQLQHQVNPTRENYLIAAVVEGKWKSAFPGGRPLTAAEEKDRWVIELNRKEGDSLKESAAKSTIVLIADTDFLSDTISSRTGRMSGQPIISPRNDNLAFFMNAIEHILGKSSLTPLRGKGRVMRPFTVVENMEDEARKRYHQSMEAVEARLFETQNKLLQLESEKTEVSEIERAAVIQKSIDTFRLEAAKLRREKREIRKKLRENIESLEQQLALLNLLILPCIIGFFGVSYFSRRNRRSQS